MRYLLMFMIVSMTMLPVMTVRAAAQSFGVDGRYEDCMRRARTDPEQGLETALAWRDGQTLEQGKPKTSTSKRRTYAAAHCEAVALTGLGRFEAAAKRLEALAGSMQAGAPKSVRAEILAQAGQAWFRADRIARARAVQTAAIALDSKNAEIRVDRAMARAAGGDYWSAIDDLNVAISLNRKDSGENADAYALRASAYRFLEVLSLAKQDVETALRLAPDNAAALLELGIILRLAGDAPAARKAWGRLMRVHDGSPAADSARKNLETLDRGAK
jgi:tetratricopeptide (TPR) repeat protein